MKRALKRLSTTFQPFVASLRLLHPRGMPVPDQAEYQVHIDFDEQAGVWYVAKSDIPGLSLEANNPQLLIDRIQECALELIQLNRAEIVNAHPERAGAAVALRPVFDSPLQLACA